jgi:hypothetical protein
MANLTIDKLMVKGDIFEIDTYPFQLATETYCRHPGPIPKGKKQCQVLRIYANSEKIVYVCKALKPTVYTTGREFILTYYYNYATF